MSAWTDEEYQQVFEYVFGSRDPQLPPDRSLDSRKDRKENIILARLVLKACWPLVEKRLSLLRTDYVQEITEQVKLRSQFRDRAERAEAERDNLTKLLAEKGIVGGETAMSYLLERDKAKAQLLEAREPIERLIEEGLGDSKDVRVWTDASDFLEETING